MVTGEFTRGPASLGIEYAEQRAWTERERIEVMIAEARNDLRDPNIHAYAECHVVYGRKPVV